MSLLDRIQYCRRRAPGGFRRFMVAGVQVGWVGHRLAERLRGHPEAFAVAADSVGVRDSLDTFDRRTRAVAESLERLREEGWFPGWRDEYFAVAPSFGAQPLMRIERGAVRHFGIRAYCVQLNGTTERDGRLQMWVARRALTKPVGPGKLDQIVGGGLPIGISVRENLLKECAEEASIPADLARQARPAGAVAYWRQDGDLSDDEVLFNYDLRLPADFTPVNADGEVAGFELWPTERVKQVLADGDDFLFDVALCIIDFLTRCGFIDSAEPDYVEIAEGLWSAP